jgi:GNAT superfamily N-acetyltransferase
MPQGIFLACTTDEVVGMSSLLTDLGRPDTLRVGYTGTHPAFRGRGIATELKRRSAEFARERGYRFLVTGNDSLNRPMLGINERFGFHAETVWIQGERPLSDIPA